MAELDSVVALIRDSFKSGMTVHEICTTFAVDRTIAKRAIRGLAKQQPLSKQDIARFWSYVNQTGGDDSCWNWRGGTAKGRGQFAANGTTHQAHRVAYILLVGPIPTGQVILQSCGNKLCVNPKHLLARTPVPTGVRGADHPLARLTWEDVQAIRTARAAGGVTLRALGERYGVSETTIRKILRNQRYRNPNKRVRAGRRVRAVYLASADALALDLSVSKDTRRGIAQLRPVELSQGDGTRTRYHLSFGTGSTLCGQPCPTTDPPSLLTYSVIRDCEHCALQVHRLSLCCPTCTRQLYVVAANGQCVQCCRNRVESEEVLGFTAIEP